jgi:glycosyltransferase involved in cell wall biosynthesis
MRAAECAPSPKLSLTVIILTYNEELHLERCINSVSALAERIIVVDSYSTDSTWDIAQRLGVEIRQRAFKHQAEQFQWALDTCDVLSDWVLRLDADEYLETALIEEIRTRLPELPDDVTGVSLKRKLIFRDKWIRFGGYYPTILLRLWRTGKAELQQVWMDEHAVLKAGKCILFKHDFCDHNLRDIGWWTEKHNRYSTRKMADFIAFEYKTARAPAREREGPNRAETWTRSLKYLLFRSAPLYLRSVLYFLFRYVICLGFLDGKQGFLWHVLQGLWYSLLIDIEIEDARGFIAAYGIEAFKDHLKAHHKIDF